LTRTDEKRKDVVQGENKHAYMILPTRQATRCGYMYRMDLINCWKRRGKGVAPKNACPEESPPIAVEKRGPVASVGRKTAKEKRKNLSPTDRSVDSSSCESRGEG